MARPTRKWTIYWASEQGGVHHRYMKLLDSNHMASVRLLSTTAYDTKKDAEAAAFLFTTKNPEFIGQLLVTHTKR